MQCGNGRLHSGDKLLDALHASVASPSLGLGCWFCFVDQTPNSAAVVRPGTAGQGCWTGTVFLHGLAISPSEICSATCGPDPGYPHGMSAEIIFVEGRQRRRKKCGKGMISAFLLTEPCLLWSHFPWELRSSRAAALGIHSCHPPAPPRPTGAPVRRICIQSM